MESAGRAKSANSLVNEQDLFVTKTSNRRVTLRPLHVRICRKMGVSMEIVFKILAPILVTMFVIGAAGCVIVIPVVAYRLFSVLVEPDAPDEQ